MCFGAVLVGVLIVCGCLQDAAVCVLVGQLQRRHFRSRDQRSAVCRRSLDVVDSELSHGAVLLRRRTTSAGLSLPRACPRTRATRPGTLTRMCPRRHTLCVRTRCAAQPCVPLATAPDTSRLASRHRTFST